ncbi:MAG: GAF domain-containing protein, partial [Abditibacteriales bacterium]|nr:GAF domain-containing protein [Abditibacteriales bacterium]MDW8366834.1 GAF domain-containing protein [Abditibacteriales bacterium]
MAELLRQHHAAVLQAWRERMAHCAELPRLQEVAQRQDLLRVLSILLKLFARHLSNPLDVRYLRYTRQIAAEQFSQGMAAREILQIVILLKRALLAFLLEHCGTDRQACEAIVTALDEEMDTLKLAVAETYHQTRESELQQQRQSLERHLQASADRLRESEQRYRELLQAERQSAGQLAMMHEVGSRALTANTLQEFLDAAARAIQKNFQYYDVLLFIADHTAREVVLAAHFGGYYQNLPKGYRQKFGVGMVGWVAEHGETLLANDVTKEPRHILAFPEEEKSRSELTVPIKLGDTVLGVVDVQSQQLNAFDQRDVSALQTLADQMATAIENIFLYQEMRDLKEFSESVIATIPAALMVVDADLRIVSVNQKFCEEMRCVHNEVVGAPLHQVFDRDLLSEVGLAAYIQETIRTGEFNELTGTRRATQDQPEKVFDIRITPLVTGNQRRALVVMTDMTQRLREAAQLRLLYQMSRFLLQDALDFNQVLYTVLTCITAGPALGFNRAFLLLLDEEQRELRGAMALGPSNPEDANVIWSEISHREMTLEDLVEAYEQFSQRQESQLQRIIKDLRIPLDGDVWPAVTDAVREKQAYRFENAPAQPEARYPSPHLETPNEFAVAPLLAGDRVIGVVVADNLFNNQPI